MCPVHAYGLSCPRAHGLWATTLRAALRRLERTENMRCLLREVERARGSHRAMAEEEGAGPKKRTFRKFSFRGIDLDALLDLPMDQFVKHVHARARRRFSRGLKAKPMALIKKLRKAKKKCTGPHDKPEVVKTHLRNMIIVPEMIGSVVGVYNGKVFNAVEIKPEMVGHYLAEFSISYKPVKHGRPGAWAHGELLCCAWPLTRAPSASAAQALARRIRPDSCPSSETPPRLPSPELAQD